jgi:mRNA turnover protein 4
MPKSKRNRVVHMTNVSKKTKEHKDRLFENIRDAVPNFQHVFVFSIENARNAHIQEVRQELSDSKYVFSPLFSRSRSLSFSPSLCFYSSSFLLSLYPIKPLPFPPFQCKHPR